MDVRLDAAALDEAAAWIRASERTVVFSGAGISVESGIPPFRGPDGLWAKYDPEFLHVTYFRAHPEASWRLIKEIFYDFIGSAEPNAAHHAIARWEGVGLVDAVVTQNIDNLHQAAGSCRVLEYHGTTRTLSCVDCGHRTASAGRLATLPPRCPECGGVLKPDFVFFGDPIPPGVHEESLARLKAADLVVLVGTTGEIMPASMLPLVAKSAGARFLEVNVKASNYTAAFTDLFLQGPATAVFGALERRLEEM